MCSYARGLFKCEKKKATCWGISEALPNLDNQSLNHMISDGVWDFQPVMNQVARRTSNFFEDKQGTALIIDEVGFAKKGRHSCGVKRQWLGCLGKTDNGQVAVGAVLNQDHLYSLVNARLFMPKCWMKDEARLKKAKVPGDLQFKTKPEIALDMITQATQNGVKFDWVGFDALYGNCFWLLDALDKMQKTFVGDVKANINIFLIEPKLSIPQSRGKTGRKPSKLKASLTPVNIENYAKTFNQDQWEIVQVRDGVKGKMKVCFHRKEVWIWDENKDYTQCYSLILRKETDGSDIKYSFTNAPQACSSQKLAYMQGQRYFVEKTFKEGKNQVGMGDYQVRSWDGFHRHIAICMMALNFIMEQKDAIFKQLPHITAEDIRKIIAFCLPDRYQTQQQLIKSLLIKHDLYARQKWIYYNKQKAEPI